MFMDVVWQGPAQSCRNLERDLTQAVRSIPGCYNDKPGGEGVKVDATHTRVSGILSSRSVAMGCHCGRHTLDGR